MSKRIQSTIYISRKREERFKSHEIKEEIIAQYIFFS